MSKRFGRNQKRKMREQLQGLQKKDASNAHNLAYYRKQVASLESELRRVIETVESICTYSAAIPAKVRTDRPYGDRWEVPLVERLSNFSVADHASDPWGILRTIDCYALKIYLEEHLGTFSTAVHLKFNGKHSAYVLSEQALRSMPESRIVEELVRHLRKQL
jgi:hypothetical protein